MILISLGPFPSSTSFSTKAANLVASAEVVPKPRCSSGGVPLINKVTLRIFTEELTPTLMTNFLT